MDNDKAMADKSTADTENKVEKAQNEGTKQAAKNTNNAKEPATKVSAKQEKTSKTMAVAHTASKNSSNKPIILVAGLGLLVAGVAALGVFYNYTQGQTMTQKEQALLDEQVQLANALNDVRSQIAELNTRNSDLNSQIESANQGIDRNRDRQAALQVSLEHVEDLTQQKGHIPLFWKYAEVEYLLTVANHRLILERDINTALLALADADARLKAIGDPALIPIRGKIADEINALNSVDRPDLPGMSARLRSLVEGIEQLPLLSKEHILTIKAQDQQDREIDNWSELPATIWKDIKSLVDIKRNDEKIEPLLPPDEKHYLSQNLGLKLEESRIALLNRDTPIFRQNLSDTREWIERYFDKESFAVTNVIGTVTELEAIELKPQLPDISGSLRQLRNWIAQHKNGKKALLKHNNKLNVAANQDMSSLSSEENLSR